MSVAPIVRTVLKIISFSSMAVYSVHADSCLKIRGIRVV